MERTFLSIGYLESYFCSELPLRPLIFVGYALWLAFLFSTLGIKFLSLDLFIFRRISICEHPSPHVL